jgi:hypothetical protein
MPPSAIARSVSSTIKSGGAVAGARVFAKQEQQLGRPRKLRRIAEAAIAAVERRLELLDRFSERLRPGQPRLAFDRPSCAGHRLEPIEQLRGGIVDA